MAYMPFQMRSLRRSPEVKIAPGKPHENKAIYRSCNNGKWKILPPEGRLSLYLRGSAKKNLLQTHAPRKWWLFWLSQSNPIACPENTAVVRRKSVPNWPAPPLGRNVTSFGLNETLLFQKLHPRRLTCPLWTISTGNPSSKPLIFRVVFAIQFSTVLSRVCPCAALWNITKTGRDSTLMFNPFWNFRHYTTENEHEPLN